MNNPNVKSNDSSKINVYKIVVVGDGAVVKKTCISSLKSYLNGKKENHVNINRTRFLNFETIYLEDEFNAVLQIWDCQGQRSTHGPLDIIQDTVINGSSLIILMFSLDNAISFFNLFSKEDSWYNLVKNSSPNNIPILLIGNKNDKPNLVLNSYIMQKIKEYPEIIGYLKISALSQEGFNELVNKIHDVILTSSPITTQMN